MLASLEPARKLGVKARPRAGQAASDQRLPTPAAAGRPARRSWMVGGLVIAVLGLGSAYVGFLLNHHATRPAPVQLAHAAQAPSPAQAAGSFAQAASPRPPAVIETLPAKAGLDDSPFRQLNIDEAEAPSAVPATTAPSVPAIKALPHAQASSPLPPALPLITRGLASGDKGRPTAADATHASAADLVASPASATERQAALTPAQKRKAAKAGDSALLTALVQHVSAHSKEEVKGVMPPLKVKGTKASFTTIAQIVNHCRSLKGEEAKVCRVRICENYWGKDDACSMKPDFHRFEASAR